MPDPKEQGGAKASGGTTKIPEPEEIACETGNVLRDILLPALIIVAALILVLVAIKFIRPDCGSNSFFILAFAILFGAAGSLFGGKIGVLLNVPVTGGLEGGGVRAVGGIAVRQIIISVFPLCGSP